MRGHLSQKIPGGLDPGRNGNLRPMKHDQTSDPPAPYRPRTSRALTALDGLTARAGAATLVAIVVVVTWVAVVASDFDADLQLVFGTICSGITVTMVFVIQHAQGRSQQATQLKLDELIRSLPQADDRVVKLEASSDAEIGEVEQRIVEHHRAQRVDEEPAPR